MSNSGRNVRPIFRFEIEQNSMLGGGGVVRFLYQFLDSLCKSSAIFLGGGGFGGLMKSELFFLVSLNFCI